jgi:hypothetical protein
MVSVARTRSHPAPTKSSPAGSEHEELDQLALHDLCSGSAGGSGESVVIAPMVEGVIVTWEEMRRKGTATAIAVHRLARSASGRLTAGTATWSPDILRRGPHGIVGHSHPLHRPPMNSNRLRPHPRTGSRLRQIVNLAEHAQSSAPKPMPPWAATVRWSSHATVRCRSCSSFSNHRVS